MATHVKVIAVLFIIFGSLMVLGAFFSTMFFNVLANIVGSSGDPESQIGVAVLGITGMALMTLLLVFGVPSIVCGIGLYKFRPWARILAIILAAISLIRIPFGTLFGIYALVILFRKDTEALFTS
jgi:hypothetical protein